MPSFPSCHRHGLLLLLLATAASRLCAAADSGSSWTLVDCQLSAASSSSTNSTFWTNVVALLSALPSAAGPTGFASLSRGNGIDRAFVRGACRGHTVPASCTAYLRNAALRIQSCNSSRRAAVWYDDGSTVSYPAPMFCFVSYADTSAPTAEEDAFRQEFQNAWEISYKDAFENAYYALMNGLAVRVVGNGNSTADVLDETSSCCNGVAIAHSC